MDTIELALHRQPGTSQLALDFPSSLDPFLHHVAQQNLSAMVAEVSELARELSNRAKGRVLKHVTEARAIEERIALTLSELDSASPHSFHDVIGSSDVIALLRRAVDTSRQQIEALPEDDVRAGLPQEILDFAYSCLAIWGGFEKLTVASEAIDLQHLTVTGPWGSGKTYHLARHARAEMEAGAAVHFVRARDLTDTGKGLLAQSQKGLVPQSMPDEAFLACLDAMGRLSGRPCLIVIDGINEWRDSRAEAQIRHVKSSVQAFPYVRLVVSRRQDQPSGVGLPSTYRHQSPLRADLSAELERSTGAVPGTEWHAALSNPLLARIAARVINSNINNGTGSLVSEQALLDGWVRVLAGEYCKLNPAGSARFVERVAGELGRAGGTSQRRALLERLGGSHEELDRVLDFLVLEGLLEQTQEQDEVRFLWQGIADIFRARVAAEAGMTSVFELFHSTPTDERPHLLDNLAAILPSITPPRELPDLLQRHLSEEELLGSFARSLSSRPPDATTPRTHELALRALRFDESSHLVLRAALQSACGGAAAISEDWFSKALGTMNVNERSEVWPSAIAGFLDSEDGVDLFRQMLGRVSSRILSISDADALELGMFLAWFNCDTTRDDVGESTVRILTELLHNHPRIFNTLIARSTQCKDDHPIEAVIAAGLGHIKRWPQNRSSEGIKSALAELGESSVAPRSFRALEDLHHARYATETSLDAGSKEPLIPLHRFLAESLQRSGGRGNTWWTFRGAPQFIDVEDSMIFKDGLRAKDVARIEASIVRELGLSNRHLKTLRKVQRIERLGLSNHMDAAMHVSSLTQGRWWARQYAQFPFGNQVWANGYHVKAGSPLNVDTRMLTESGQTMIPILDASVPVSISMFRSDSTTEGAWWSPDITKRIDRDTSIITDENDVEWVIISGGLRYLSPAPEEADAPVFNVGQKIVRMAEPKKDGTPMPGSRGHLFLQFDASLEGPAASSKQAQRGFGGSFERWSDIFKAEGSGHHTTETHEGGSSFIAPNYRLLSLLQASWTGEDVDCTNAEGVLVITNPAGARGPRMIAVRRNALTEALAEQNATLEIRIKLVDFKYRLPGSGDKNATIHWS
ncbi:hypothetical protein ACIQH5_05015 [Paenarthrobacter sp. NPDC091711]|uniref:hypothetical protein n=1 Tax=Paenarthrobacter sp. NPDC091711 TaxID=3364385 RepID=UPI0038136EE1